MRQYPAASLLSANIRSWKVFLDKAMVQKEMFGRLDCVFTRHYSSAMRQKLRHISYDSAELFASVTSFGIASTFEVSNLTFLQVY